MSTFRLQEGRLPQVQQGAKSPLVELYFPHCWTWVLEGPTGRGLSVSIPPAPRAQLVGVSSTWRAAETEKPTRPELRCALLSTAHMAATNTSPFPRSSRLAASHLQGEAGNSRASRALSVGPASLGTRTGHHSSSGTRGGPSNGPLHTPDPTQAQWGWEADTALSHLSPALGLAVQ